MTPAETALLARLHAARIRPRTDYTTGEVARILGVARETVRQMILRYEPPQIPNRNPTGLFAYRLATHHRVPHAALTDWFANNTAWERHYHGDVGQ